MQKIVEEMQVSGHQCVGCQRVKRPVMVTVRDSADVVNVKFVDIFLTNDQAVELVKQVESARKAAEGYVFE